MGLACDLRQVRHAEHLSAIAERAQLPTDDFGDAAADARVDFVEDEAGQGIALHCGDLDREADARQFATRGDLGQRPRRLPGIGADQEFDLVARRRRGPQTPAIARTSTLKRAAGHAERLHQCR